MSRPSVLIVEDNAQLGEIFSLTLQSLGLTVHWVADGQSALASLAENTPDLALLDLHLPNVSGREVLHYIRGQERLAHLPVILATADDHLGELLQSEADLLLLKPISTGQLRQLVSRLLSLKSRE